MDKYIRTTFYSRHHFISNILINYRWNFTFTIKWNMRRILYLRNKSPQHLFGLHNIWRQLKYNGLR